MHPIVSVMMVSRNNESFIKDAVQSVVSQTFSRWELVIVDNGSTDRSLEVVNEAASKDTRIKVVETSQLPLARARNLGLRYSRGTFLAVLDGDDLWMREKLALQIEMMTHPCNSDIGVCGANAILINSVGEHIGEKRYPSSHVECDKAFWFRNPFCHSATLIRRDALLNIGGYDEALQLAEDLELWFRLSRAYRLHNIQHSLVKYRISNGNATFQRHREMVTASIQIRMAASRYVHDLPVGAKIGMRLTRVASWLPPKVAHQLFNCLILRSNLRTKATDGSMNGHWPRAILTL